MGRKSNTKKAVRKLVEEKYEEEKKKLIKKKNRKELKKEAKKEVKSRSHKTSKPHKTSKSHKKGKIHKKPPKKTEKKVQKPLKKRIIHKKAIFGAVLAMIMIAILVSVGFLLFRKAFRPEPIAKILPADTTIASIEINTNFDHSQTSKTFELLKNYDKYSKEALLELVAGKLEIADVKSLNPWFGRNVGAAMIKPDKNEINIIYFAETYAPEDTIKNANLKKQDTFKGKTIYENGGALFYAFLGDYFVASDSDLVLKYLIEAQNDKKLYSSAKYRRIDDNMPAIRMANIYLNFENVDDSVLASFEGLAETGISQSTIKPFMNFIKDEGIAVIAMDNQFALQGFTSLTSENLNDGQFISAQEKYHANLTEYIGENVLVFWGGQDLGHQLKRLIEVMADADIKAINAFDTVIENYAHKYLGPHISFKEDVEPLFENEFAFVVSPVGDTYGYKVLIELTDPLAQALKINEIADNFSTIGAIFEPKIVTHELEDGTKSKEIIAVPEEIARSEEEYRDVTIYELQMGNREWGIYYAIVDDLAIITSHPELTKTTIDLAKGGSGGLKESEIYSKQIFPILSSSDAVSYFNLEKLFPMFLDESEMKIFEPISSLSTGKNFFNDGIASISYIKVK